MTTAYKIKDVADRTGFSTATLRYYEEIGLLPESTRTAGGYRQYDDHTLDRLAFIARAKQLGCTLEEIGDLTLAWEGGQCGPVQDRLRDVVAAKLAGTQAQIVELITLSDQLRQAATSLERHRPQGPCDDACGCISAPAEMQLRQPVSLTAKPAHRNEPVAIACSLSATEMPDRLTQWSALLSHMAHRDDIADGVRVSFLPSAPFDELMRLVAAEQSCCQFFAFAITVDDRGVALEVHGPPDALPLVHALFGASR
jgi:MerR family transcriptional regulator, copper efflux regulator